MDKAKLLIKSNKLFHNLFKIKNNLIKIGFNFENHGAFQILIQIDKIHNNFKIINLMQIQINFYKK